MMPRFTIERVRQKLNTKGLADLRIITEVTGQKKNRSYSYEAYIDLLDR